MLTFNLQDMKKQTGLTLGMIRELSHTKQFPDPILFDDGTFRWSVDSVADWIEKHDAFTFLSGLQSWWRISIYMRKQEYQRMLNEMSSDHSRSHHFW